MAIDRPTSRTAWQKTGRFRLPLGPNRNSERKRPAGFSSVNARRIGSSQSDGSLLIRRNSWNGGRAHWFVARADGNDHCRCSGILCPACRSLRKGCVRRCDTRKTDHQESRRRTHHSTLRSRPIRAPKSSSKFVCRRAAGIRQRKSADRRSASHSAWQASMRAFVEHVQ